MQELEETMDASSFMEWIAYEMSCDPKFNEKVNKEIALEESAKQTTEQRAEALRNLLMGISSGSN